MIPRQPVRQPRLGCLYLPPYRVEGISIAGEQTVVHVPELDVAFDIGLCPRAALSAKYVALSHGHMDHSAALSYYFSQRNFQGMGTGTVVCHPDLAGPVRRMLKAWADIEGQQTPFTIIEIEPDQELEIKGTFFLRAFKTEHTATSLGFVVIEKRSKLRKDLVGLEQEELMALKQKGEQITRIIEVPLVCYTGDTMWGAHFEREDVLGANILITECTFIEPAHRSRAAVGKHLHVDDLARLMRHTRAEHIVLTHLSRRTNMNSAYRFLEMALGEQDMHRIHVLMDIRRNQERFDQQLDEAQRENEAQSSA